MYHGTQMQFTKYLGAYCEKVFIKLDLKVPLSALDYAFMAVNVHAWSPRIIASLESNKDRLLELEPTWRRE